MAARFDPSHPHHLTPEQRLHELCDLLATAYRRMKECRGADVPNFLSDFSLNCLDVSPQTRLHGPVELTQEKKLKGVA